MIRRHSTCDKAQKAALDLSNKPFIKQTALCTVILKIKSIHTARDKIKKLIIITMAAGITLVVYTPTSSNHSDYDFAI